MKFRLFSFLTLAFAFLVSGCSGYKIGPIQPTYMAGIESLAVPTFRNETLEPRLEMLVTNTVIQQLQNDGTYKVKREEDADAVLEGIIEKVERRRARGVRGNVLLTREFDIIVRIRYRVVRPSTGEILADRMTDGRTSFFINQDLQQDERQAIPLAAEEAALRLVSEISEGW